MSGSMQEIEKVILFQPLWFFENGTRKIDPTHYILSNTIIRSCLWPQSQFDVLYWDLDGLFGLSLLLFPTSPSPLASSINPNLLRASQDFSKCRSVLYFHHDSMCFCTLHASALCKNPSSSRHFKTSTQSALGPHLGQEPGASRRPSAADGWRKL